MTERKFDAQPEPLRDPAANLKDRYTLKDRFSELSNNQIQQLNYQERLSSENVSKYMFLLNKYQLNKRASLFCQKTLKIKTHTQLMKSLEQLNGQQQPNRQKSPGKNKDKPTLPKVDSDPQEIPTNKEETSNLTHQERKLKVFCTNSDETIWKPEARSNHTLTLLNGVAYLIGGFGTKVHNQIITLDLKSTRWHPISQPKFLISDNNYKLLHLPSRYNHSTVAFNQEIVMFGGEDEFNIRSKARQICKDIIVYNPTKNSWRYLISKGDDLQPRRNHAAIVMGRQMIVIGGINQQEEYLNELVVLDFMTQKWVNYSKWFDPHLLPFKLGIAYHQICPAFEDITQNLFLQHKSIFAQSLGLIKEEGIYLFGGRNAEGEYLSGIYVLKNTYPIMPWKQLVTQGKLPQKRANHQMCMMPQIGCMVVSGGKNESGNKTRYFSDIHLLDLKTLDWIKVEIYGLPKDPTSDHAIVVSDS